MVNPLVRQIEGVSNVRVSDGLWRYAAQEPARIALVIGMKRWSYGELQMEIALFGKELHRRGMRRGERIAICLPNSAAYLISFMAAARYGWVAMTIAESATDAELDRLLGLVRPGAVVAGSKWVEAKQSLLGRVAEQSIIIASKDEGEGGFQWPELLVKASVADQIDQIEQNQVDQIDQIEVDQVDPSEADQIEVIEPSLAEPVDSFYIGFTSGSSGLPKGVVRRHTAWLQSFAAASAAFGLTSADRFLVPGPLHFSASLFAAVHILEIGATLYLNRRFNPRRITALITDQGITGIFMVPTLYQSLITESKSIAAPQPANQVRSLISCGEKLRPSVRSELQSHLPAAQIYEYYGSSEVGFMTVMPPDRSDKSHSVGIAFPEVDLRIKPQDGSAAPQGTVGILYARSPMMAAGYDGEGGSLIPFLDHDGWACTGDLAYMDGDGLLYIAGRADDAINSGGVLLFPAEVEAVLAAHPAVAEVAVVGRPNPNRGEEIVAAIVLKPGAHVSKAELRALSLRGLPPYKRPRTLLVLPDLPRTETGKVSRQALRAQLAQPPAK